MPGKFAEGTAVAQVIAQNPKRVVRALEAELQQQQLDAIEEAVVPDASDEQIRDTLHRTRAKLLRVKHPKRAAILGELDARINELDKGQGQGPPDNAGPPENAGQ